MRIVFTALFLFLFFLPQNHEANAFAYENYLQTSSLSIGQQAPEINQENPDGKSMSLSSLKGKIVLVDFWASWCGPCRRENPNLVRIYEKYKGAKFQKAKGFEIYSVSLDNNKEAWKGAIEKDGLIWKYHVSDLKRWKNEAAQRYGVNSIPSSYLIDQNGVIIAKNLRGAAIDQQLDALIKSL